MRVVWRRIRDFLTAEEVPRWFGLSLVLIYLVGLGSVAQFAFVQSRKEAATRFQHAGQYAVRSLADRLSALADPSVEEVQRKGLYQRALRELSASIPVHWARIVSDERLVVASTSPLEVNATASGPAGAGGPPSTAYFSVAEIPGGEGEGASLFIRVRIPDRFSFLGNDPAQTNVTTSDDGHGVRSSSCRLYVEALLHSEPVSSSSPANHARMLAIVLIVLGALFVVYRCLREQLRGVSHIASRLSAASGRVNQLNEDLDGLRVADTLGVVTRAWNELIDLVKHLQEAQRKAKADDELSEVLKRASGGALAEALSAMPDALLYIRDETRPEYVNSAACRLFGWNPGDIRSVTIADRAGTHGGEKALDAVRRARQAGGSFERLNELIEVPPDGGGDQSWYRVKVFPLKGGPPTFGGGECVVLITDVSQQVRADRAREDFMTQVTHELRTPLTNIRAYAETLSSGMFDDPKVITECYNVITKETRRLSRLIEDMLSVSQLEVGTVELSVGRVDLKTLLTEGVRDVRGLADEKNIDVQLVLPAKMEPIDGDRDKLAVVINNLLGNAIKYTPRDGNVIVGCQFSGNEVVISLKDNGVGIDPKDHARIFEKFQRADDPSVLAEPGNGIGLYTAREIVRRHQGQLEVISQKGLGSTFLVRLPHVGSRASVV